jgi:hypothetical protein
VSKRRSYHGTLRLKSVTVRATWVIAGNSGINPPGGSLMEQEVSIAARR